MEKNNTETYDTYYIEVHIPSGTTLDSVFDETYYGMDNFVYPANDITSQFMSIKKDIDNNVVEVDIPIGIKKQIADDIADTVVLSESITTYGLPFDEILTNTTIEIPENTIHLYKRIVRSIVLATFNKVSKIAIDKQLIDILTRFCKWHEDNATWDKCGQDYYVIKNILNKIELNNNKDI